MLVRRGLLDGDRLDADGCDDPLQTDHAALASCYDAAVRGVAQFGQRTGQPTLRLIDPAAATEANERTTRAVTVGGFNVYAGRAIDGRDRKQLERQLVRSTPNAFARGVGLGRRSARRLATAPSAARPWPSTGSRSYRMAACATA